MSVRVWDYIRLYISHNLKKSTYKTMDVPAVVVIDKEKTGSTVVATRYGVIGKNPVRNKKASFACSISCF